MASTNSGGQYWQARQSLIQDSLCHVWLCPSVVLLIALLIFLSAIAKAGVDLSQADLFWPLVFVGIASVALIAITIFALTRLVRLFKALGSLDPEILL